MFGLLDIPWWCYAIAVMIGIVVSRFWIWEGGFLVGYTFLVLVETLLIRKPFTGEHLRLEFFWSWRVWEIQKAQILANVVMFIPIGVLAGLIWKWQGFWLAVGLSVVIEVLQLVTGRGLCEIDDIVHNVFGAFIGFVIIQVVRRRCEWSLP